MGVPGRGSSGNRGPSMENERERMMEGLRSNNLGKGNARPGPGGPMSKPPPMMPGGAASQSVHGTRSTAPASAQEQVMITSEIHASYSNVKS